MSEPVQFDKAEYVEVSSLDCKLCRLPLQGQYFDMAGVTICSDCERKIAEGRADGSGPRRFFRAAGFGFLAAAVGAVVYALIVNLTGFQFGLMAVVLGFAVGKAVSVGSYHRGGWPYQVLAMGLTYVAICMEFFPQMFGALTKWGSVMRLVIALLSSLVLPILAVFLSGGASGLIGIFIIGIGLYEAWKLNKAGRTQIGGPYPISPPVSGSVPVAN